MTADQKGNRCATCPRPYDPCSLCLRHVHAPTSPAELVRENETLRRVVNRWAEKAQARMDRILELEGQLADALVKGENEEKLDGDGAE